LPILSGETLVAITGALGGGILVKLVDRRYQLKEKTIDVGEAFRKEARLDIVALKEELRLLRQEVVDWQTKYYKLFEENAILKAKHEVTVSELAREESNHSREVSDDE
jgi:hypothetical protein